MNKNQSGSLMFNGTLFNLARIDIDAVQRPYKQVFSVNNLVLLI